MKYSITRALSELKMLNKKIEQGIKDLSVSYVTNNGTQSQKEREEEAKKQTADLQSVKDLIDRAYKIKRAVIRSNGSTEISVNGEKMTVAEAIVTKDLISYEASLVREISVQLQRKDAEINQRSQNAIDQAQNVASQLADKDDKQAFDSVYETVMQKLKPQVVEAKDLDKEFKNLKDRVSGFEHEVDFVLSESNTLTTIEI